MPEKPEVVTVAASLTNKILDHQITGCSVYWKNIIAYPTSEEFQKKVVGEVIHSITTHGKFLVLELDHYHL